MEKQGEISMKFVEYAGSSCIEKLCIVLSHINFHIVPCFAAESHGARDRSLPVNPMDSR